MVFIEFFGVLLMFAFLMTIVFMPAALIIADFRHFVKKKEAPVFELVAFLTGGAYMFLGLVCWNMLGYREFYSNHLVVITVLSLCGFSAYHKLKFKRRSYYPNVNKLLLAGMYVGVAVSVVWLARLSDLVSKEEGQLGPLAYFIIACECIVPFIYLIHCIHLMVVMEKEKRE